MLRMRNGTSQSPFRLALGDNPCAPVRPAPGHGYVTTGPQGGGRTSPWPYVEWLDGGSDALASGLCGFGTSPLRHAGQTPAPTPTGDYRPSLRSPWPAAKVTPCPLQGVMDRLQRGTAVGTSKAGAGLKSHLQVEAPGLRIKGNLADRPVVFKEDVAKIRLRLGCC